MNREKHEEVGMPECRNAGISKSLWQLPGWASRLTTIDAYPVLLATSLSEK